MQDVHVHQDATRHRLCISCLSCLIHPSSCSKVQCMCCPCLHFTCISSTTNPWTCALPHACRQGYVRMHTTMGDLNIELHCDIAPRTCENFLGLAGMHYYDGTVFHRSIKNFMIQVGLRRSILSCLHALACSHSRPCEGAMSQPIQPPLCIVLGHYL
eukprot:1158507-Pelagomonas_calceolata.AAC.5